MPLMEGDKATQLLRQEGLKTPILALTAHATEEEREKSLAAGCDDYLIKPIRAAELCRAVAKWAKVPATR